MLCSIGFKTILYDAITGADPGIRRGAHPFPESHTHYPKTTPLIIHLMGGTHIARQSVVTAQMI